MATKSRSIARTRRHTRVRKNLTGSTQRPRLNVFRSLSGIYAQIIDDQAGHTLVSASTVDGELREKVKGLLSKMRTKSAPLSAMLKNKAEEVMEKVSARMKKAEHTGEKVNTDDVVKEEWTKILSKVDTVGSKSDREEIEKIYKQLSGEE